MQFFDPLGRPCVTMPDVEHAQAILSISSRTRTTAAADSRYISSQIIVGGLSALTYAL